MITAILAFRIGSGNAVRMTRTEAQALIPVPSALLEKQTSDASADSAEVVVASGSAARVAADLVDAEHGRASRAAEGVAVTSQAMQGMAAFTSGAAEVARRAGAKFRVLAGEANVMSFFLVGIIVTIALFVASAFLMWCGVFTPKAKTSSYFYEIGADDSTSDADEERDVVAEINPVEWGHGDSGVILSRLTSDYVARAASLSTECGSSPTIERQDTSDPEQALVDKLDEVASLLRGPVQLRGSSTGGWKMGKQSRFMTVDPSGTDVSPPTRARSKSAGSQTPKTQLRRWTGAHLKWFMTEDECLKGMAPNSSTYVTQITSVDVKEDTVEARSAKVDRPDSPRTNEVAISHTLGGETVVTHVVCASQEAADNLYMNVVELRKLVKQCKRELRADAESPTRVGKEASMTSPGLKGTPNWGFGVAGL